MGDPIQRAGGADKRARRAPEPSESEAARPRGNAAANAGPVADLIRRFAALGLSGFFTTEGAIRRALGDTVPQEWVDFVTDQGERGRQELFDRLAVEMGRILEGLDVTELLDHLLTGREVEIEARVRIGPRRAGSGGARGTRRRTRGAEPTATDDDPDAPDETTA